MRRIELGYGMSVTGELAGTVSLVVYAFSAGGAPLVAAYAASRTLTGVGVMLVLAGVTGRLRRDRSLRLITGLRTVLLAVAALPAPPLQTPGVRISLAVARSVLARGHQAPLR